MSCVLPEQIKALKADVKKNGGAKFLREMSSQERIDYFAKFTDYQPGNKIENRENAEMLNRQVEQKMLQPAQTTAIREWLKELPDDKRLNTFDRKKAILELMQDRKDILNPKSDKFFMEALVKQALGFEASLEDVKTLTNLSATVEEQKKKLYKIVPDYEAKSAEDARDAAWSTDEGRQAWLDMGESLLKFKEQFDIMNIKSENKGAEQESAIQKVKQSWNNIKTGDAKGAIENIGKATWQSIKATPGLMKTSVASVDLSATFRQLRGLWLTHPNLAAKAATAGLQAFETELKTGGGKKLGLMNLMMRPNALNGMYEKFGLDIGIAEEAFPDTVYEKIKDKNIGKVARFVTASDAAYSIASQTGRAEFFDAMYEANNLQLLQVQNVGKVANQLTGRGDISDWVKPKVEKGLNLLMFSPRYFKSRIDMLTDAFVYGRHYFKDTPYGNLAKASINNYIFIGVMAAFAAALRSWLTTDEPDEVWAKTFDPRSAQFLQAKISNTHIDITGGEGAFLRTFARILSGKTMTGEGLTKKQKGSETAGRFLGGKMSPAFRTGVNVFKLMFEENPKNYNFDPITAQSVIEESFAPITLRNLREAVQSKDWSAWVAFGADFVGLSAQYWAPSEKNLGKSADLVREEERLAFKTNKAVSSLKARSNAALNTKLTGATRERANREFETKLSTSLDKLINSSAYKKMSDAQKAKALTRERTKIQNEVKKSYGIK